MLGFALIVFLGISGSVSAQPVISRQPANASVSLGANAVFGVLVDTNSLPLTYQWQKDGADLAGATSSSLVIPNVQLTSVATFRVVVSNGGGSVTSNPATLTVDPTFTKITDGAVVSEPGQTVGCAWGDFDNDGWVDLLVVRGSVLESSQNHLFRNARDGTFTKVTSGHLVSVFSSSVGATWADYDNDGNLDLFVARAGDEPNGLYRNLGDGTFANITSPPFAFLPGNTQSGVWADFDNDGHLDLFLTARNSPASPSGQHNVLYHNLGNGNFVLMTGTAISSVPSGNYRPGIWADYDNDGDLDIFLNRFLAFSNFLFRNDGDGTFTSVTNNVVLAAGGGSRGAAWADFDNDGDLDLFNADALQQGNQLFRNDGNGAFVRLGTNVMTGFVANAAYPAWGDYDNDGFIDLFVPNGESTGENNSLYRNNGNGTFTRMTTGSPVNDGGNSVACGWADIDNNGFLDLFVGNLRGQTNFLYRNNGNTNHWLKFKLSGAASNRAGIGAKVRVTATIRGSARTQLREISSGSGHNGGELIAHFGLGDATTATTVRVEWPSGQVQEINNVAADQLQTLTEPAATSPLTIRANPKDQAAGIGEAASFHVSYSGAGPVSFQWLRDGQPLSGSTSQVLSVGNVQRSLAGDYQVVVRGGGISLTSKVARLLIDPFSKVFGEITAYGGSRGGAWADYDSDGDLDVLIWNGGQNGALNYFFTNEGSAGFSLVTSGSVARDTSDHHSAAWVDFENDGDLDLFTANIDEDPNDLFRNNGDGTFGHFGSATESGDYAGFGGASWADYDNDGLADLFIANSRGRANMLYHNEGGGDFLKVTTGVVAESGGISGGAAWSDYDDDGKIDLFASSADGANFLFHNLGQGNFENEARSSVATGRGIGADWGDYDNDGRMDLVVVSDTEPISLFHNEGSGVFTPVRVPAFEANIVSSYGASFGDYDNDGLLDLFVAGNGRNTLYRNSGNGAFVEVTHTQVSVVQGNSYACSWADIDNDGFLDLFTANGSDADDTPNLLFRNNGNSNHWVTIRLKATVSNRAAIGAKVRVRARIQGNDRWQKREITGGDGYGATRPLEANFGLGDATRLDQVTIEWPSGIVQELSNVAVDQILTITEARGAPRLRAAQNGAELRVTLIGEPSAGYRIEVTDDLRTWTTLTTVTIVNTDGTVVFSDALRVDRPTRFYRAVRL